MREMIDWCIVHNKIAYTKLQLLVINEVMKFLVERKIIHESNSLLEDVRSREEATSRAAEPV